MCCLYKILMSKFKEPTISIRFVQKKKILRNSLNIFHYRWPKSKSKWATSQGTHVTNALGEETGINFVSNVKEILNKLCVHLKQ